MIEPTPDPAASRPPPPPRDTTTQRVRVGVTGLAAVFLLTLLAASLFSLFGPNRHGRNTIANAAANSADQTPQEPLAELGVAPGNAPDNTAAPVATAPPPAIAPAAPPPNTVPVPRLNLSPGRQPIPPPARR